MSNSLKKIRTIKGITQQECADYLGVSLRTIQRYENQYIGGFDNTKKLSDYLGFSVDELLEENDEADINDK